MSKVFYVLNTKRYVWGKSNTSLNTPLRIFKHGYGCIMLWVCLSTARTTDFLGWIKINEKELSTNRILEENLVLSAFQKRLGDKFSRTIT
jgi:hypothetical protein